MALTTIQAGIRFNPGPGRIAAFCRANGIRKLSLFGSALTDRFRDDSDMDLSIEFEPEQRTGYLRMAVLERELPDIIGRQADLRTAGELSRYFREDVLRDAVPQYERR
jgi:predicted nucleotidyltransferase